MAALASSWASSGGTPSPPSPPGWSPGSSGLLSDPPPKLALTPDQLRYCSDALSRLREKLRHPEAVEIEFDALQAKSVRRNGRSCKVATSLTNLEKNRYTDVLPFDDTRVVLNSTKDCESLGCGFINASFIKASSDKRVSQFIATQGPLPHTFQDFWEMVFQYHCPLIVMLTRLVDHGRIVKCDSYFPADEGKSQYGKIRVTNKHSLETDTSLVLRSLEVEYRETEEPPSPVLHIQYPNWPDHGVPQSTLAIRQIMKRMYHIPPDVGPIVVHCRFVIYAISGIELMSVALNLYELYQCLCIAGLKPEKGGWRRQGHLAVLILPDPCLHCLFGNQVEEKEVLSLYGADRT